MRFAVSHRRLWQIPALLVALLSLGACASAPSYERAPRAAVHVPDAAAPLGETIADLAMGMLGVPYRYGGSDPRQGFDCSGLVYYTYTQAGLPVPRTSVEQFKAARKISIHDAAAGDLMFFQDQAKLSHVGIYVGDGLFVHAPATGQVVSVASIDSPYYQSHLVGVGRLLAR